MAVVSFTPGGWPLHRGRVSGVPWLRAGIARLARSAYFTARSAYFASCLDGQGAAGRTAVT
jgi:hypothetical protein